MIHLLGRITLTISSIRNLTSGGMILLLKTDICSCRMLEWVSYRLRKVTSMIWAQWKRQKIQQFSSPLSCLFFLLSGFTGYFFSCRLLAIWLETCMLRRIKSLPYSTCRRFYIFIPLLCKDILLLDWQSGFVVSLCMQKVIDGRNYYTVEYVLTSANFARASFVSLAIANGNFHRLLPSQSFIFIVMRTMKLWKEFLWEHSRDAEESFPCPN